jgi:DNA gyrase subunit A
MDVAYLDGFVLVVSSDGYGKLTPVEQYPCQHRAGSGVITFKTTDKTGGITAARVVNKTQQVMIISADGKVIRTPVKESDPRKGITVQGRSTQGVKLMDLNEGDQAVAITAFD